MRTGAVATTQAQFDSIRAEVRRVTARLGQVTDLDRRDIEHAVDAVQVSAPSAELVALAVDDTEMGPLAMLTCALALRRAALGTAIESPWSAILAWRASDAIYDLGGLRLFGLRLELLDEVLADPAGPGPRAMLHFQRANTRRALGDSSDEALALVMADLRAAILLAQQGRNVEVVVRVLSMLAPITAATRSADPAAVASLDAKIVAALESGTSNGQRALLLQARAALARSCRPGEAVAFLEAARGLLPSDDPLRLDLAGELLTALVATGRAQDAVDHGRELLGARRTAPGTLSEALLYGAFGQALAVTGDSAEGRWYLRSALDMFRGRDPRNATTMRLQLADLEISAGDLSAAAEHLQMIDAPSVPLDATQRLDLATITARLAEARGDTAGQRRALETAEALAGDRRQRLRLRLERTLIDVAARTPGLELDDVLVEAMAVDNDATIDGLIMKLAAEPTAVPGPATRGALCAWAARRNLPSVAARLLHRDGLVAEAVAGLRRACATADALSLVERLRCVHLLVIFLGPADGSERWTYCEELEHLLERVGDDPHVRLDLAVGMRSSAGRDLDRLRRAWAHAERALGQVDDNRIVEHAYGVLGRIAVDIVEASRPASTKEAASKAAWLGGELKLPPNVRGEFRLSAASMLLIAGPLAHPSALAAARQLLQLARRDLGSGVRGRAVDALGRYEARLAWIDDRLAGAGRSDAAEPGPFDDAPRWLIALVVRGDLIPDDAGEGVAAQVEAAWVARPDRHEALRAALDRWQAATAKTGNDADNVPAWFAEGVRLMSEVRRAPYDPGMRDKVNRARRLLDDATVASRRASLPGLFDCLVSLGNAWRLSPGSDVDRALAHYAEASPLEADRYRRATLWKVHADGLRERGRADDLRRAEVLLKDCLEVRRDGYLRAETLISAAQVEERHPDRDETARAMRMTEHLMSAVRADPTTALQVLRQIVESLSTWERLEPTDQRPRQYREELARAFPDRRTEIAARVGEAPATSDVHVSRFSESPAARAFLAVRERLMTAPERQAMPRSLRDRLGEVVLRRVEADAVQRSLLGRPDEAETVLAALKSVEDPATKPGTVAAEVLLLALLSRCGRRTVREVRVQTEAAVREAQRVDDPIVASLLLREVAHVWAPFDPDGNAVCDFAFAATLLRRAVELEGGIEAALIETVGFLARAVRYSAAGAGEAHLREARDLYEVALRKARDDGDPNVIANLLDNLAEVEAQLGEGGRHSRLEHAVALIEEAVEIVRDDDRRARYQASLAWTLAQRGFIADGKEGAAWLERARRMFDLVDQERLDPLHRRNFERNRETYETVVEERTGQRPAAIARRRRELAKAAGSAEPHAIATAKHNLAITLMFGDHVTGDELREGLRLATEAALVRTIARNARHHWQTSYDAGRAIVLQLEAKRVADLGMSAPRAWAEAQRWLRQAIAAGRALGAGQELADAGMALCMLVAHTHSAVQAEDTAEEAWTAVREAMPFLLRTPEYRMREARHALRVAGNLAIRHAVEGVAAESAGIKFMLVGDRARSVERWLLRAQVPARRPTRARLAQPSAVAPATWRAWQAALSGEDDRAVVEALRGVRAESPGFLHEDGDGAWVVNWLEGHPRGAAVAAFIFGSVFLVWLVTADEGGAARTCILGIEGRPAPVSHAQLAELTSAALSEPAEVRRAQDEMAEWAREYVARPIVRLLGGNPPSVLWCPGPGLRLVAPAEIWPESEVATTIAMEGPAVRTSPGRQRSTLIALADPGPGGAAQPLGRHGREALDRLAAIAGERGAVKLMGSIGARFGRDLLDGVSGIRHTPVSPHDLLAEAEEHAIVVVIAHGELGHNGGTILCLDATGAIARLTEDMLAASPLAFAGSTIMLLTCSAGQVTADLADPGGLAGTLLTAGARCVVAPLWPVRLDVATDVAEAVLRGAGFGDEPSRSLTHVQRRADDDSPTLGGAPTPAATRRRDDEGQRRAFIAWVG